MVVLLAWQGVWRLVLQTHQGHPLATQASLTPKDLLTPTRLCIWGLLSLKFWQTHITTRTRHLLAPHSVGFQIGRWQNGGATSFSKNQRERMCIYLAGSDYEHSSVSRITLVLEMPVLDHFLLFTNVHFYNDGIQRKRNNKYCFQRPSFPKLRQQG